MVLPQWLSTIASIGMAIGPSLVYADQAYSIIRKKDATGFSRDICAVLLLANIMRCYFWLGDPFEFALLMQSILLILSMLAMLYICLLYKPITSPENLGASTRPGSFWQWPTYAQYIEFLAGYMLVFFMLHLRIPCLLDCSVVLTILFLIFGRYDTFVQVLGFVSLGIESTLPFPQLYNNWRNKTLYGFRLSTMAGWVGGDAFKAAYFFSQGSPIPFKLGSIVQLSADCVICVQRVLYGAAPPVPASLDELAEEQQALALEADV
ncbi:hypothetical protein PENSPDRAFT_633754 [Peniophora sp. CONT]|nr:hypothetical protein PENSPDRAFT_633754 [Peniophora sp. CONT]